MKKSFKKLLLLSALLVFVFSTHAQFTSSESNKSNKGTDQSNPNANRQKDIYLLEQKAKTMEQDVLNNNTTVFNKHKSEVLAIMDREMKRGSSELVELKYKLKKVPGGPGSQEGRDLQIAINQMDGRVGRQKLIRSNVASLTKKAHNKTDG